ncbi:MAG TPA: hypothetical protein VF730_02615 [Terracidiphilus sp.]
MCAFFSQIQDTVGVELTSMAPGAAVISGPVLGVLVQDPGARLENKFESLQMQALTHFHFFARSAEILIEASCAQKCFAANRAVEAAPEAALDIIAQRLGARQKQGSGRFRRNGLSHLVEPPVYARCELPFRILVRQPAHYQSTEITGDQMVHHVRFDEAGTGADVVVHKENDIAGRLACAGITRRRQSEVGCVKEPPDPAISAKFVSDPARLRIFAIADDDDIKLRICLIPQRCQCTSQRIGSLPRCHNQSARQAFRGLILFLQLQAALSLSARKAGSSVRLPQIAR